MHGVPVRTAGRQRERRARGDAEEPSPRIEGVHQRNEVVLVGAAAVQEDKRARRVTGRRAQAVPGPSAGELTERAGRSRPRAGSGAA